MCLGSVGRGVIMLANFIHKLLSSDFLLSIALVKEHDIATTLPDVRSQRCQSDLCGNELLKHQKCLVHNC